MHAELDRKVASVDSHIKTTCNMPCKHMHVADANHYNTVLGSMLRVLKSKSKKVIPALAFASLLASVPAFPNSAKRHTNIQYDIMVGETFRVDTKEIKCIVYPVNQTAPYTTLYYLINGLGNKGDWYQFGDTPEKDPKYRDFTYEVWERKFPLLRWLSLTKGPECGRSVINVDNAPVNDTSKRPMAKDPTLFDMRFSNGYLTMFGKDLVTGGSITRKFKSKDAKFIGISGSRTDIDGCYSGFLSEMYVPSKEIGKENAVRYVIEIPKNIHSVGVWEQVQKYKKSRFDTDTSNKQKIIGNIKHHNVEWIKIGPRTIGVSSKVFITGYNRNHK